MVCALSYVTWHGLHLGHEQHVGGGAQQTATQQRGMQRAAIAVAAGHVQHAAVQPPRLHRPACCLRQHIALFSLAQRAPKLFFSRKENASSPKTAFGKRNVANAAETKSVAIQGRPRDCNSWNAPASSWHHR